MVRAMGVLYLPQLDLSLGISMDTAKEPERSEWAHHSFHFSNNGRHIKDDPVNSANAKVAQLATMHFIQIVKGKCSQAVIMYSHCPPRVTCQPVLTFVHCRGHHDSAGKNTKKNEPRGLPLYVSVIGQVELVT